MPHRVMPPSAALPTGAEAPGREDLEAVSSRDAVASALGTVQPLGWVALVATVFAVLCGWLTGWFEMWVLAGMAGGALLVAVLSAFGRSHYAVDLNLRVMRVVAGQPATGRLVVRNTARRRLLSTVMELPVGGVVTSFRVPSLKGRMEREESFALPTERRAVIPIGPARSVRGDAIGLVRRVAYWTGQHTVYVHPRTVAVHGGVPGFIKDLEGQATREIANDDVAFHALRGYVPGDDRRYVHWKASARSLSTPAQTLMVRQFEETRRSHLGVALSLRATEYASDDEFELAVSAAASLAAQAFREQRELSVGTSGDIADTRTSRRMLDELSAIEQSADALPLVDTARTLSEAVPTLSVVFLVFGSKPLADQVRLAAAAFPLGVRVIAVQVAEGAAVAMRRIGATPILTIGELDVLPRALRQAVRLT